MDNENLSNENKDNHEELTFFEKISQANFSKKHIENIVSNRLISILMALLVLGFALCIIDYPSFTAIGGFIVSGTFGFYASCQLYQMLITWLKLFKEKEFLKFTIGLIFLLTSLLVAPSLVIGLFAGTFIHITLDAGNSSS